MKYENRQKIFQRYIDEKEFEKSNLENLFVILGNAAKKQLKNYKKIIKELKNVKKYGKIWQRYRMYVRLGKYKKLRKGVEMKPTNV